MRTNRVTFCSRPNQNVQVEATYPSDVRRDARRLVIELSSTRPWSRRQLHKGPIAYSWQPKTKENARQLSACAFMVFNLELREGLEPAYLTGLDTDEFDAICDHLVVEHAPTKKIVGTYRLQTGPTAAQIAATTAHVNSTLHPTNHCESKLLSWAKLIVELVRACIHRDHRSTDVLVSSLAWNCRLAVARGGRYLIGCYVTDFAGWPVRHGGL